MKVSVVVAAYNSEKYIEQCLNSLINQSIDDVEFIVVDDCSTDKTGTVIKEFAKFDERIKYISTKENSGPMIARKVGSENAEGEFIMYLDADDYLSHKSCEVAYKAIKKAKVDILQFETHIFTELKNKSLLENEINNMYEYLQSPKEKIFSPGKAGLLRNKSVCENMNFSVWNKIYKKSIVDKANQYLPDKRLLMAEDLLFSFVVFFVAHSYAYNKAKLYNYRFGCGISTTDKISDQRIDSVIKSIMVYNYIKDWTNQENCTEICESRINSIKKQIYNNIGYTLLFQTPKSKRNFYVNELIKYSSVEQFIEMMYQMVYVNMTTSIHTLAEICADLDIFKPTRKDVRTIATFYYRMYNGGVERVISKLTDIWVKAGYKVVLFTDSKPNENDYYINPEVKRVILPSIGTNDIEKFQKRMSVMQDALKKYNVDTMVYHAWNNTKSIVDAMIVKATGASFIVHTHNAFCIDTLCPDPWYAHFSAVLPKIYSFYDMTIALNKSDRAFWNSYGLKCIHTINPNGIPLDTEISSLNGNNVVMVSRLAYEKQNLDGVKIIEKVIEKIPDATLTIVGDGDDKYYVDCIKEYIKKNKLEDNIKMVGFKRDVIPYYQSADVMLMTSKYEGAPMTIVESKICGVPLVSYKIPNLDTLREGKGVIVVPQNDIEKAAEKIIEILSNDDLKRMLGKKSRKSAEEILSVDLEAHWDYVFKETLSEDSKLPEQSTTQELDAAIETFATYASEGILIRSGNNMSGSAALIATIDEIKHSTSYRLGWFLTTIPRKIKDYLIKKGIVERRPRH